MDTRMDGQTHNKGVVTALLFGAAVGAAAVILSDQSTRKKVKNRLSDMVDTGKEKMNEMKSKAEDKLDEGKAMTARKLETAKNTVEKSRKKTTV